MLDLWRAPRSVVTVVAGVVAVLAACVSLSSATLPISSPASSAGSSSVVLGAGASSAITGSYIVKLKDNASARSRDTAAVARDLAAAHHGNVGHVWDLALHGFSMEMSAAEARRMASEPAVAYVAQDQRMVLAGTASQANPPSWGLDRADQRTLPLDQTYKYDDTAGAGVHAYVVDSGIRISHIDFGGRASYGWDFIDNDGVADDCVGHGTLVAGVIGGGMFGVAKKAQLVALRAFDCMGNASSTSVMDSINWIIGHAVKPAVVNLSLADECETSAGMPAPCAPGTDQMVVDAISNTVKAGIPVVLAAGNQNIDACGVPFTSVADAITVGAVNQSGARWVSTATNGSDFGSCVDLWAPGDNITSDYFKSDVATGTSAGTSLAAPHVTGAVALLQGTAQFAKATPTQITTQLLSVATNGVLTNLGTGSPNRLLFVGPPVATGGSSVALARNDNGRLELFGVNNDGFMFWNAEQSAGTGVWGNWNQSATTGWFSVGAEPNSDGRIELAGLTTPGSIWRRQQDAINSANWFNWTHLDGLLTSVAIARNQNKKLLMVGANQQGEVFYRTQIAFGSRLWGQWAPLPFPGQMRAIAAAANADERVQVIAVDSTGAVWQTSQTTANADTWFGWSQITTSGFTATQVALARNNDTTLELVATDGEGGVWRIQQDTASSLSWSGWSQISSDKILRQVAAETNSQNRVHLVGVDNSGNIWQATQTTAGAITYSPWTQIPGQLRS